MSNWSELGGHIVGGGSVGSFETRLDQSVDRDDGWDG